MSFHANHSQHVLVPVQLSSIPNGDSNNQSYIMVLPRATDSGGPSVPATATAPAPPAPPAPPQALSSSSSSSSPTFAPFSMAQVVPPGIISPGCAPQSTCDDLGLDALLSPNFSLTHSMPGANLATPSDQADLICDEINDRGDPSQPQANTEEEGMGLNNDATMEDARPATERRRNAQASARFRKRRREREQDMMNTIESMRGEVHELKIRVQELRAENRLLRDILKTNGPRSAG